MQIETRPMEARDLPACATILNHIIALGGSTAYEEPFSVADLTREYLHDPAISLVALAEGRVVGFQAVFDAGPGVFSIGSFTDRRAPVRGAGRALFEAMREACRARGGSAILAKITADNAGGLAFYAAMGFEDHARIAGDHIRPDGNRVDRIVKRYLL